MLTIVQGANHEEVERFQERDLLEAKWGGRDDRVRGEGAKMPYDVSTASRKPSLTRQKKEFGSRRWVWRIVF